MEIGLSSFLCLLKSKFGEERLVYSTLPWGTKILSFTVRHSVI